MTELEMIKAFAKLDGVKVEILYGIENEDFRKNVYYKRPTGYDVYTKLKEYNPIANLSLTFKAMVKYDVDVIISEGLVEIDGEHVTFYQKDRLLPKAIIECILKSRGLYK